MREWPTLLVVCTTEDLAAVEEMLLEVAAGLSDPAGYRGCRQQAEAAGGRVRLHLTCSSLRCLEEMRQGVEQSAGGLDLDLSLTTEADRDWVAEVAGTEKAVPLGRSYAALPGQAPPLPGRAGIRLPRSRAFGTGEHATTQMAAALVEAWAEPGTPMLDLGTGTGILAILGHKLGCQPVVAVDVDPVACGIACQALKANDAGAVGLVAGTVDALGSQQAYRLMVANIEQDVLVATMPQMVQRLLPGGLLILTGLLREQVDRVAEAAAAEGAVELERRWHGEWGALLVTLRPAALPRILVKGNAVEGGSRIAIPNQEAHHLTRVRRVRDGAAVEACDGHGNLWHGRLAAVNGGWALEEVRSTQAHIEPALQVTLYPAWLHESGRMEQVIQQAVELGVTRIQPIITRRCQATRRRQAPLERWRRVAAEALKQCGRSVLPEVGEPVRLEDLAAGTATRFFLDPAGPSLAAVVDAQPAPRTAGLLVGPEGGLEAAERALLLAEEWRSVRLGPRILRAGTAATAALAVLLSRWGDLGKKPVS